MSGPHTLGPWKPGVGSWKWGVFFLILLLAAAPASAQVNMPDPSQINGKALPAPELPNATVTVRVVRESIGNDITGQEVRLVIGGTTRRATTDDQGRAEFRDLPHDGGAHAETTVAGETIVSDPFDVPASGGLRVILISGVAQAAARKQAADAAAAQAPPTRGVVVFGGNSRVLVQFNDDAMQVFYVLDVVNNARTRVDIGGPLIIDLPSGSGGARALEGSAPSATVNGNRITILGPFAPGTTSVQVGFQLLYNSANITFDQKWPATLQQLTVGVQKVGNLAMSSPQFTSTNEMRTDDGIVLIVGRGGALAAGAPLTISMTDLPIHSRVPRYAALGLAGAVILFGVFLVVSAKDSSGKARQALVERREALLTELARLEPGHMAGGVDPEAMTRRRLFAQLEQIYGELDDREISEATEASRNARAPFDPASQPIDAQPGRAI